MGSIHPPIHPSIHPSIHPNPIYYPRPTPAPSQYSNSNPGSHTYVIPVTPPPSLLLRGYTCLDFYRGKNPAFSSPLVDSPRILQTPRLRLLPFFSFSFSRELEKKKTALAGLESMTSALVYSPGLTTIVYGKRNNNNIPGISDITEGAYQANK